jgi:hypothetical protein
MSLATEPRADLKKRSKVNRSNVVRKYLKVLSLALLFLAPAWAVMALLLNFVIFGLPTNFAHFGASLDAILPRLTPALVAGGILWLLVRIDERLEQRMS